MTQVLIDRATLEQLVAALNEVDQHVDLKRYDTAPNEVLFDVVMEAMVKGRAALANAEPTNSYDLAKRADNGGLGMTTLQEAAMRKALELGKKYAKCLMMNQAPFDEALAVLAQQGGQQPVCAGCGIPVGDVHMSTCKSGKWPSRVSNGDTAAPAPQAQGETK